MAAETHDRLEVRLEHDRPGRGGEPIDLGIQLTHVAVRFVDRGAKRRVVEIAASYGDPLALEVDVDCSTPSGGNRQCRAGSSPPTHPATGDSKPGELSDDLVAAVARRTRRG